MKLKSVVMISMFVALGAGAGCSSHSEVRASFMIDVNNGDYAVAEGKLREIGGKKKIDFLVDTCDMAMVMSRAGKYQEANEFLQQADDKIKEYFTENVTDVLAAIGWNESTGNYKGEEFERNMVDLLQAMNYLSMGNYEAARIEAQQANTKLADFVELLKRNNVTSGFVSDPFAYFMTGLAFEAAASKEAGDQRYRLLDEARLAYTKALQDYQGLGGRYGAEVPTGLPADLERIKAEVCNPSDMPASGVCNQGSTQAELIVVTGVGQIPHKQSLKWIQSDGKDNLVVTYPEFFESPTRVQGARVDINGNQYWTSTIYDVGKVAVEVNKERLDQLKDKAIARAMAKYITKKAARAVADVGNRVGGSGGGIAALIGSIVSLGVQVAEAVEVADTRSWMSLPNRYTMARFPVEPGVQKFNLEFVDAAGLPVSTIPVEANVEQGGKTFVFLYSMDRQGVAQTRKFGPGMMEEAAQAPASAEAQM
jgi:uncharacterized protein